MKNPTKQIQSEIRPIKRTFSIKDVITDKEKTSSINNDDFKNEPIISNNKTSPYQELLNHPKWQRKRLEIMQRDDFKCAICHDDETTLHVHHKKYNNGNKPWEYTNDLLITLCKHCHNFIEILVKRTAGFNIDNLFGGIFKTDYPKIGLIKIYHYNTKVIIMFINESGETIMASFLNDNEVFKLIDSFKSDQNYHDIPPFA